MEYNLEKNSNSYISTEISIINIENNNNLSNKQKHILYIIKLIIIILLFIFIYSIHFGKIAHPLKKPKLPQLNQKNIYNIDSNYQTLSPKDEKYIYIPIIGTNDIHGRFFPTNNHFYANGEKIEYKAGGLEYIAKYINILKNEYGENRVLYFDSGDQFFQTNESIIFDGNNIFEFLNKVGLNGTTLGNIDYLYKRDYIENKIMKLN